MSHLLLVGGGHAHVEIVRRLAKRPVPGFGATIVSKDARPIYSGMVPGFVAGQYAADELEIDLPALAAAAGVRFVHAGVDRIDPRGCFAVLDNGETIPWVLASLDVGATVATRACPSRRAASCESGEH